MSHAGDRDHRASQIAMTEIAMTEITGPATSAGPVSFPRVVVLLQMTADA